MSSMFSRKDAAIDYIINRMENESDGDGVLSDERYAAVREALNLIWENEVPGVRYDCGGAIKK